MFFGFLIKTGGEKGKSKVFLFPLATTSTESDSVKIAPTRILSKVEVKRKKIVLIFYGARMDGDVVFTQGGIMQTKTNVRDFPSAQTEETAELSGLDRFLIWAGAKKMAHTPKTGTTSPMEWNKSVLSLTATLIAILAVLVGFVWNYAAMSTKFELQQQKMIQIESRTDRLEAEIDRFKEFQIKSDAYRLGLADSHGNEVKK